MMGASHYNLDEFDQAADRMRQAIEAASEPEQRYYELLNAIYSEQGDPQARTRLLEEMVEIWPDKLTYWRQLSSLYMQQDEQMKAFAALEAAYLNGLIEKEDDIVMLAQYYSTFENPHRGAQLLEEEMEAGNVARDKENLELLSQLWSQAREHARAIPVLREAAELSDDGELFFRLGQALLADEKYAEAEQALESALDKGGLEDAKTAEAWILLGTARFNQAEPGDQEQREEADEAFARAQRFDSTRRQAADWRNYISAIEKTEQRQAALEQQQSERLAQSARERLLTACRARELAGSDLSERCREILAEAERDDGGGGSTQ
jgi:tetratricopeptide (TPR) repeat protein